MLPPQARFMTPGEIEDVALAAARKLPEPKLEGDDPHDSPTWQRWRDDVDKAIAAALREIGLRGRNQERRLHHGRGDRYRQNPEGCHPHRARAGLPMNERLMPDPIGYTGGILTETELVACLSLLARLNAPTCASVALTWDHDTQNAWIMLCRAGYAGSVPVAPRTPFTWDRIQATDAGRLWRAQIMRARTREAVAA